jgi:hypothetical protein
MPPDVSKSVHLPNQTLIKIAPGHGPSLGGYPLSVAQSLIKEHCEDRQAAQTRSPAVPVWMV